MDDNRRDREKRRALRRRHEKTAAYREKRAEVRAKRNLSRRWRSKKLSVMALFFLCVIAFFLFEISQWQSFAGEAHAIRTLAQIVNRHSEGDRMIRPTRGTIVDRNMQSLAVSSTVYNVFVDVRMLMQRVEPAPGSERRNEREDNRLVLMEFFGMTSDEFATMTARNADGTLVNNTHYFVIQRDLTHSEIEAYEAWLVDMRDAHPGFRIRDIHIEEYSHRSYIQGNLAAPIIGFERGVWWGLERQFNDYLIGSLGREMTTFSNEGNLITERISPINGATVVTTLDMAIQRFAEELIAERTPDFQASNGSIIVMQPFTGEIVAMAQYPSFDANYPADIDRVIGADLTARLAELGGDDSQFFEYLNEAWRNFNITSTFEPGSIYKSITVAKALEAGIITPNSTFYCPGFKYVAGHRIHCVRTWGHGMISLTQALAVSCNVAHMDIAEMLGRNLFWQYQRDFGYGIPTGIDFPGENAGYVFSVAGLNDSELATSSFGQRFTTTPIQSIASFATLINGGNVVRPHFVSQIIDGHGNIVFSQPQQVQRRVISQDTSDWVRRAMEYVITDGTARPAEIEGFAQGGKTGTAEQGTPDDPNYSYSLSFIGYFPVENPQYLIMVLIHDMPISVWEGGRRTVTPIYREMALEIMRLRNILPSEAAESLIMAQNYQVVEDFVGMPVRQAVTRLNSLGVEYEFVGGAGNVITSQFPPAGTRVTENVRIVMSIENDGSIHLAEVPNVTNLSVPLAQEILSGYGFVPRVVYDGLSSDDDYSEAATRVHSQAVSGIRLPAGTEILLRAQHLH